MLDTICEVMKAAYERSWISTRDGNASFRRKDNPYLYVTPSGVRKQHMNAEMIIKMRFNEIQSQIDEPWMRLERVDDEYQRRIVGLSPTGELKMHALLQNTVSENRVVLHLHPTYTIAAMYSGIELSELAQEFPEIHRYTKVGPNLPLIQPVSLDLAQAAVNAFGYDKELGTLKYDIIGLDRHGIVAVGKDAWTAFEHVERLEHICKIYLCSKSTRKIANL